MKSYYIVWTGKISGTRWVFPALFKTESNAIKHGQHLVNEEFATEFIIRETEHKSIDSFEEDHLHKEDSNYE